MNSFKKILKEEALELRNWKYKSITLFFEGGSYVLLYASKRRKNDDYYSWNQAKLRKKIKSIDPTIKKIFWTNSGVFFNSNISPEEWLKHKQDIGFDFVEYEGRIYND